MQGKIFSHVLLSIATTVTAIAQLPDLTVPYGQFSPANVNRGSMMTIQAAVKNQGIASSSASHLAFYISPTSNVASGTCVACVSVEPLPAGGVSETKLVNIVVPSTLAAGSYYIGWIVDPYGEVAESDDANGFYLPNTQLIVSNNLVFGRHLPYPVILVHGLNSNDLTWNTLTATFDALGWSGGGRLDYCLNYDGNLNTALCPDDIHDFTITASLNNGDYYTVNFDVDVDGTDYDNTVQSNMAAIVKQGRAMQSAIQHVLDKTGSDKVILVGHSMGGLASREYLQNPAIWQSDGKHHVAKLLTIGTPHGGSDIWTFGLVDGYSEAVRDLRTCYSSGAVGTYLFGGNEHDLATLGFHNYDVNCNGHLQDAIVGLNQKNLYVDLAYTCIIGNFFVTGDGVVAAGKADLNNYYSSLDADTLLVAAFHTDLTSEVSTCFKGLDEPTYFNQAYHVGMDTLYFGYVSTQSAGRSFTDDFDDYTIDIASSSLVSVKVTNIPVPHLSVAFFDHSYNLVSMSQSSYKSQIDTSVMLGPGKYYCEIQAAPDGVIWKFPYSFKLHATPLTTVTDNDATHIPRDIELSQNFPNPFNPVTTIRFALSHREEVRLAIYNVLGEKVAELVNGTREAGTYDETFNGSNLSSGVYFYRLEAGSFRQTKKLILLR